MFFFADRLVYCCVKVAVEKRFTIQQHIAIRDKRVILEYIMKYNEENKLKKNKKKISHNVVYFIVIVWPIHDPVRKLFRFSAAFLSCNIPLSVSSIINNITIYCVLIILVYYIHNK